MPDKPETSFVELFVRHQRSIYGYILSIVPNANEADDIFQEASLILWKKADEFDAKQEFLSWAYGIARNVARNHRAKMARDRHRFSEEFLERIAEARAERSEWLDSALAELAECLERLTVSQRGILTLRYDGERTIEEVARELDRPANSVYQQLHRIRRKLYLCVRAGLRRRSK